MIEYLVAFIPVENGLVVKQLKRDGNTYLCDGNEFLFKDKVKSQKRHSGYWKSVEKHINERDVVILLFTERDKIPTSIFEAILQNNRTLYSLNHISLSSCADSPKMLSEMFKIQNTKATIMNNASKAAGESAEIDPFLINIQENVSTDTNCLMNTLVGVLGNQKDKLKTACTGQKKLENRLDARMHHIEESRGSYQSRIDKLKAVLQNI